jgi:hypothetical protein
MIEKGKKKKTQYVRVRDKTERGPTYSWEKIQ